MKRSTSLTLLDSVDWEALPEEFGVKVFALNAWVVVTSTFIEDDKVFVSNARSVVAMHPSAWATLCFNDKAKAALLAEAMGQWKHMGDSGMRQLLDCPGYPDALRSQELATRPAVVDTLADVAEHARRLIVAAAGLSDSRDQRQVRLFVQELSGLQLQVHDMEDRLSRVKALVALAEEAVCG